MKKIFAIALTFCMLSINAMPVFARNNIKDVPAKYWASKEIQNVVNNNIMSLDSSSKFYPEKAVTRVEFVQALLKILSNDNLNIKIKNEFSDINKSDYYYEDILRSQQLGLVYGYPDKTFKPYRTMLRSEVTSGFELFKEIVNLDLYEEYNNRMHEMIENYGNELLILDDHKAAAAYLALLDDNEISVTLRNDLLSIFLADIKLSE